jgi:hypothetical protein
MEIPWGNIVTAIATVIAVVIANKLTLKRTSSEKIWDFRRQAYGEILSALSQVENVLDLAREWMQEGLMRYFDEQISQTHNERISENMVAARKRFSDDYLVLSREFILRYEAMQKELDANDADSNLTPDESHMAFDATIRKHRTRLLEVARSEVLGAKAK